MVKVKGQGHQGQECKILVFSLQGLKFSEFSLISEYKIEGIKLVPSVCLSVCVSVSALTAEPFDIRTQNSVEGISCCNVWNVCVRRSIGQEY